MLIATPTPAYRQAGVPSPVRDCVVIVIFPFVTQSLTGEGNYYYSTLTEKSHQKSHHQN